MNLKLRCAVIFADKKKGNIRLETFKQSINKFISYMNAKKIFKELEKALLLPVIVLIYFYQKVLSPFFQPSCRFYPSCSQYSLQAIKKLWVLWHFLYDL